MEAKCRSARAQLWTSGVRLSIVMTHDYNKSIGLPVWKGYEEQPQMEAADLCMMGIVKCKQMLSDAYCFV